MGLYSITTRAEGTVLTGFGATTEDIFNGDHENHVEHTAAEFLNSWEATLAQMQETTSPVTAGGSLVLGAALSDEIERIRFQIARIKQQMAGAATAPFWYTAAADFSNGVQLAPTAARIEQITSQNIPSGPFTQITFDSTVYNTASMVTGSTLVAPVDGVYICGGTLGFGDGVSQGPLGDFMVVLQTNLLTATTNICANNVSSNVDEPKAINVETVKRLTAGTALRMLVHQNSGTTKPTLIDTDARPAMWMSLVGRG